jgi:hypothetical protein
MLRMSPLSPVPLCNVTFYLRALDLLLGTHGGRPYFGLSECRLVRIIAHAFFFGFFLCDSVPSELAGMLCVHAALPFSFSFFAT